MLVNAPPGYRLAVGDTDCDIGRFILRRPRACRPPPQGHFEEASRHLTTALAEWRGPVLEDLRDFEFVDGFATALTEDKVVAHTALAEVEIACGRGYAVIGALESLTVEAPVPRATVGATDHRLLPGRPSVGGTRGLPAAEDHLADDLGIDPGPTLRALHERILRQEPLDVKKAARTTVRTRPGRVGDLVSGQT